MSTFTQWQQRLALSWGELHHLAASVMDEWKELNGGGRMPARGSQEDDVSMFHDLLLDAMEAIDEADAYAGRYLNGVVR